MPAGLMQQRIGAGLVPQYIRTGLMPQHMLLRQACPCMLRDPNLHSGYLVRACTLKDCIHADQLCGLQHWLLRLRGQA